MSNITADQARANSQSSTYGAAQVVSQVSSSVEATSKTGATSVTLIFSKQAVSSSELQSAITTLEDRGFTVQQVGTTAAQHTIQVSW